MLLLLTCGPRFCHSELIPGFCGDPRWTADNAEWTAVATRDRSDGERVSLDDDSWEYMCHHFFPCHCPCCIDGFGGVAVDGGGLCSIYLFLNICRIRLEKVHWLYISVYQPFNPIMVTRLLNSFTKAHSLPLILLPHFRQYCFPVSLTVVAEKHLFPISSDHPPHKQDAMLRAGERKLGKLGCVWAMVSGRPQ